MRYAIYTRGNQDFICALQHLRLEQYAKDHNMDVVAHYTDIGSIDPAEDLPGLTAMMKDYAADKYDCVLVVDYARLSRTPRVFPFPIVAENENVPYAQMIQLFEAIAHANHNDTSSV